LFLLPPVVCHFDAGFEEYFVVEKSLEVLPGFGADLLQGASALAYYNAFL